VLMTVRQLEAGRGGRGKPSTAGGAARRQTASPGIWRKSSRSVIANGAAWGRFPRAATSPLQSFVTTTRKDF
jgi:hypothetical protein